MVNTKKNNFQTNIDKEFAHNNINLVTYV